MKTKSNRKWIGVLVVGVWLVAIGLLMRREFGGWFAPGGQAGALHYAEAAAGSVAYAVLVPGTPSPESDLGGAQRVGVVRMESKTETRNGFPGSTARVDAQMALHLLGKETQLRIDGDVWRPNDPETAGKQLELDFRVGSQGHEFRLVAELVDHLLKGELRTGGETYPYEFPMPPDVMVESSLGMSLRFPQMKIGETMSVTSFDPMSLSVGRTRVRCVAEETLVLSGVEVETKRLELKASGIDAVAWIDASGDVMRAETQLGIVLERIPDGAVDSPGGSPPGEDDAATASAEFLRHTSVTPTGLKPRRGASRLVLRLSGGDSVPPFDPAQLSVGFDADSVTLEIRNPAPGADWAGDVLIPPATGHLSGDFFEQSFEAEIIDRAREIVGDETDAWRRAQLLHDWVFERIEKEPVVSIPSALEVLRQRRGDCNEHTVLYAALAKALEIPTRTAIGLVWSDELDGFYYHAWPEVFIGRPSGDGSWIRVDPTLGQPVADATHVKLLQGSITDWPQLLAYLGKLEIEVLEMDGPEADSR